MRSGAGHSANRRCCRSGSPDRTTRTRVGSRCRNTGRSAHHQDTADRTHDKKSRAARICLPAHGGVSVVHRRRSRQRTGTIARRGRSRSRARPRPAILPTTRRARSSHRRARGRTRTPAGRRHRPRRWRPPAGDRPRCGTAAAGRRAHPRLRPRPARQPPTQTTDDAHSSTSPAASNRLAMTTGWARRTFDFGTRWSRATTAIELRDCVCARTADDRRVVLDAEEADPPRVDRAGGGNGSEQEDGEVPNRRRAQQR